MQREYQVAYKLLNAAQKQAVDWIDGPVLIIAGPGTGKTQLLTTRVAHILSVTDSLPHNILCLTFSESAAHTMRERLIGLIGKAAYDVTISTYHAFGSDLIRRYPEYFYTKYDSRPADDLTIDSIYRDIIENLPYSDPLKFAASYLDDIKTFVSDAKRALLTPEDINLVVKHNQEFLTKSAVFIKKNIASVPRISKSSVPLFQALYEDIVTIKQPELGNNLLSLKTMATRDLASALESVNAEGRTTALTQWKDRWLIKDKNNQFILDGTRTNNKILSASRIYKQYLAKLDELNYYDYDDMILRAISGLRDNDELRNTVQEQYLYIMLDEFQDTNGAQLGLIELLTDNEVNEGRPNVLAVGDDDQAIYAFQGAHYSHMNQFRDHYNGTKVITLTDNYRSTASIQSLADGISAQITDRLDTRAKKLEHTLETAKSNTDIERRDAKSEAAQFAWVANKIKNLTNKEGIALNDIAVLAPQHRYLEPLVTFLHHNKIPVSYEKRENILDDYTLSQLFTMANLVLSLAHRQTAKADELWPQILSFDFWSIDTSKIWSLSWGSREKSLDWTSAILQDPELRSIGLFFIRLGNLSSSQPLENMLDYLVGTSELDLGEAETQLFKSPYYEYYFGSTAKHEQAGTFWQLLTNLTILRSKLLEYRPEEDRPHLLGELLEFVRRHREAGIKILNTSPYTEADQAVQLMTVYKAKGQEYEAVFIVSTNNETWGSQARHGHSRLPLPPNLEFVHYSGLTEDERLRLFYVAVTRPKSQLYLVNYMNSYSGKATTRLKYLDESEKDGHWISPLLPKDSRSISPIEQTATIPTQELANYWRSHHRALLTEKNLASLIRQRLVNYQLSPTHLNHFIDLEYSGPESFLLQIILRFPIAPSPQVEYGTAVHETLQWIHLNNKERGKLPTLAEIQKTFADKLQKRYLSEGELTRLLERGNSALKAYLKQRHSTINPNNESEYSFRAENVFIDDVHLSGKIDKLIIDRDKKTIAIVDYKTGPSYARWQGIAKLHKYRQQLYLYKLLVENSRSFKGYKVIDAYLEFIEPDEQGDINELHLIFDEEEMATLKKLVAAVWNHIQKLDFPATSVYGNDLAAIRQFEKDLIGDVI